MTMDKLVLIGNLGVDPTTRQLTNGQTVTSFTLACERLWRNKQEEMQKETAWYRINAWNAQGESCQKYLHKGNLVYVEGQLSAKPTVYHNSAGESVSNYEVRASSVKFLNTKTGEGSAGDEQEDYPF